MADNKKQNDPAKTLNEMLKGNFGKLDKKAFIVAPKFDNAFMRLFVKNMEAQKLSNKVIIDMLLQFDELAQKGELTEDNFETVLNKYLSS